MKRIMIALSILVATPVIGLQNNWKPGESAPKFTAQELGGRTRSIKELENEGPFFLYFVRDGDPVNDMAKPYIDRIVNAYIPCKAKWYAVVDMTHSRARAWASESVLPYHVLIDKDQTIRRLFKVEDSPTIIQVSVTGKIVHAWSGISGDGLKKMNRIVAQVNKMRVHNFDFSRTPSVTQHGRAY